MSPLPVRRFPIRCPIPQAQRRLERIRQGGWFRRTLSWLLTRLSPSAPNSDPPTAAFEVIHLPCCWLEGPVAVGQEADPNRRLAVLVDGYARAAQFVHPGNREHLEPSGTVGEFPFPLSISETLEFASQAIITARLGRRLRGPLSPSAPADLHPVLIAEYPYLALHFTRDERRDFLLFDLFLARPAGSLARQAFLAALHHQAARDDSK